MFLVLCCVLFGLIFYYTIRSHRYWTKRNVKSEVPVPIFGTHYKYVLGIESCADTVTNLYKKYKHEKLFGYYRGNTPELVIMDPELVRRVLAVDFDCFYNRGLKVGHVDKNPIMFNLFSARGDRWKFIRQHFTPAFTTKRLKNMYPLIVNCAGKMEKFVNQIISKEEYDVKELMARFTTEFIGAVAFGIDMDTISDEKSQFRQLGKRIFDYSLKDILVLTLLELFPELSENFVGGILTEEFDIVMKLYQKISKDRNYKPIGRNDFIDLLLELEGQGKIVGDSIEKTNPDGTPIRKEMILEVRYTAAQIFIFFAAGFETSSSASSCLLHHLAYHPDIQVKVQKEIDDVLAKHDNKLCYDAVSEMKYLEMAFKEAIRIFPPLGVLNRECMAKYTFPGTNVTIDPGVKIMIPVQGLQNDEQYFENPEEFRPERFAEENGSRHKFVYMPFGDGPRNCIGSRLGQMQSLAGLAAFLHKFSVTPSKSSSRKLRADPKSHVVQSMANGVPLKICRREKPT